MFVRNGDELIMKENKVLKFRPGLKDCWNAYLVREANFSENDIPLCPTIISKLPTKIITWMEAKKVHKELIQKDSNYVSNAYICFYVDYQYFDGPKSSIWTFSKDALRVIKHFKGIITPDFSTYVDFPKPILLYNTYRMRDFGYWIGSNGKEVINNVRWGYDDTYGYCFDGIEKDSIVAIGTVGGSPRKLVDRERFELGFYELVERLTPRMIIVYGSANYSCFDKATSKGIEIIRYPSHTNSAFKKETMDEQRQ